MNSVQRHVAPQGKIKLPSASNSTRQTSVPRALLQNNGGKKAGPERIKPMSRGTIQPLSNILSKVATHLQVRYTFIEENVISKNMALKVQFQV